MYGDAMDNTSESRDTMEVELIHTYLSAQYGQYQ